MCDPARQMNSGNHLFQIKLVEQTALTVFMPTHHPDHPRFPPQTSESADRAAFKQSFSTVLGDKQTFSPERRQCGGFRPFIRPGLNSRFVP